MLEKMDLHTIVDTSGEKVTSKLHGSDGYSETQHHRFTIDDDACEELLNHKHSLDDDACKEFLNHKHGIDGEACKELLNHKHGLDEDACQVLPNHKHGLEGDACKELPNHKHNHDASERLNNSASHSSSMENGVNTPFLTDLNKSQEDNGDIIFRNGVRRISCEIVCEDNFTGSSDEENDTITSRFDLQKINSTKSRTSERSKHSRKESFEQRLRRTFTIRDAHTSEVTKRILAIVIKYSLFVFNFVSWVFAVAAIGLGIWMRTDKTLLVTRDTEFYLDLPLMTCVGGSVTFIVAFLGCVGALRENLILLRVFFYVLAIILIGEMALALAVFIIYAVPEARDNFLRSQPEKILYTAIEKYMDDIQVKNWVDRIQSEFECCGISHDDEGFRDWKINPYFNCSKSNRSIYRCAVPTSCCIFEKGDRINIMCGFDMTDKPLVDVRDYIHTRGCIVGFGEWLGKYNDFIIISCLSVIIMQLLAVLSARMMVGRIRKQRANWRVLLQSSSSSSANTVTRNT